jgi:acid phosphatase family membrane protein YuiD
MSQSASKELALNIGSQCAGIQSNVARLQAMVMQAAIYQQPGVAESARQEANLLDDMVAALWQDLRRFKKAIEA